MSTTIKKDERERKTCRGCNRRRAVKFFSKDKRNDDGLRNYCKECEAENRRKYRARQNSVATPSAKIKKNFPEPAPEQSIEAQAIRNALLILRRRFNEEYQIILSSEIRRLSAAQKPEEERWIAFDESA